MRSVEEVLIVVVFGVFRLFNMVFVVKLSLWLECLKLGLLRCWMAFCFL